MTPVASRPGCDRWCDTEGTPLTLFCRVELVDEDPEHGALPSRLGQQGEVVGRGLESFFVRFPDHAVVSVSPQVLRMVPGPASEQC